MNMPFSRLTGLFAVPLFALLLATESRADVVMIVNAANTTTLSESDLKRIMLGRLNQFPGAGPAIPLLRSTRWEQWEACTTRFVGKSPGEMERNWATRVFSGQSEAPKVIFTDSEAVQAVAANSAAITCVDAAALKGTAASSVRVVAK